MTPRPQHPDPVDALIDELCDRTLYFTTQPGEHWPPLTTLAIATTNPARLAETRQTPGGWLINGTFHPTGEEKAVAAHLRRLANNPSRTRRPPKPPGRGDTSPSHPDTPARAPRPS